LLNTSLDLYSGDIEQAFNLEKLINLPMLSLIYSQIGHGHGAAGILHALQSFCSILSTRKQVGRLAAIKLEFDLFIPPQLRVPIDFDTFSLGVDCLVAWCRLDNILTTHPFAETSITFIYSTSRKSLETLDSRAKKISDCLPKLTASGRLRVDVTG